MKKIKVALSLIFLVLGGCSTQIKKTDISISQEFSDEQLLSGIYFWSSPITNSDLPDIDILALNNDMRLFLKSISTRKKSDRLDALINKLQSQYFSILYDADATLNAAQVFDQQRGNCMAFSAFLVAMIRELGVDAKFNEVFVPEVRYLESQQTFVYQHINVVADTGSRQRILDFNFTDYNPEYNQKELEDKAAFAKFYSNLAMEFLADRDFKNAFLYIRKSMLLAPEEADLWNNLGAIYRSAGLVKQAISSYAIALKLDGANLVSLSNLEKVLRAQGDLQMANVLSAKLHDYRQEDPYYWYGQALTAYEDELYELAANKAEDAISIKKEDHRFHFLLGMARLKSGAKGYQRSFKKALALSENSRDQDQYRRKLKSLGIPELERTRFRERRRLIVLGSWWWLN
ncbi:transglutaminase domain-containing protein [Microbulbifer sp. CNSA002]|uniref:transglutaminase domain-containing protein n=1 Tax=Microbulbifer sp. CNSA002 TaxID=3373604 RepID=UPI0039B5F3F4